MKQIITFFALIFSYMLCGAQATTLTINNKVAGTLSQRILYDDKLTIENLFITGELNGDDLKFIQELNSSYKLTGTLDVSEANLTGSGSYGNLTNNINVKAFRTYKRLNKLILPKSATKWTESACFSSSAGITHLNVDSLIISEPKFTAIGGIGNPSYLYIGEGVETFYMNNSEGGKKYSGTVEFDLPSTLKSIYITSSKVGNPDYITVHANMLSIPEGFRNSNGNTPSKEELAFFAKGIAYVPEGTKAIYQTSMFKNLEIIAPVSVAKISLDNTSVKMKAGETCKLSATIYPNDADNKSIIWQSSNPEVVTVDSQGKVNAIQGGEAKIIVMSVENNNIKDECTVTVLQPTTGISLDKSEIEIIEDESIQIIATVLPENATNKSVNWTSSDISVAMVSPDGTVYALKAGQATIMATTVDGGLVALCKVTVKAKTIQISNIELSSNSESIAVGETLQLNAIISPDNASNKTVNWTSTNPSIASVNATGLVSAIAEGKTQIIATTTDGSNLSAICEIIVNKQFISVSQIQITPSNAKITVGQTLNLSAAIAPDDATNKAIKWSSTNPAIATVSESGVVSAISEGNAIIIASTQDGSNLSATCQVEVYTETILVETINLNPMKIEGAVNDTYEIEAIVLPTNATNKNLTWKSSDESIVTVDDGTITLHALGTAIITAEAMDGSKVKSECNIIVSHEAGIDSIIADKESYVKVFNLSGYLVYDGIYSEAKLAPGFYIVLCNGTSYKTKVD